MAAEVSGEGGEARMNDDDRASPFYSNWGPSDGPIRYRDGPPAIGVLTDLDAPPMPIGIAFAVGWVADDRGPVALFRLEVRKHDLPGRYVCVGRRFIQVDE
jgi:hypothetical protein